MSKVTGKRLFGWVTCLLMGISLTRTTVLFLEAVAAVREERLADAELLEVCASGAARASGKMRLACLQAQSDRASPVVLKGVVRAVSTAWSEFRDSVATPFGFASVVLFVLSSVLLPVIPWMRAILCAWVGDEDAYEDERPSDLEHHVIVLAGENGNFNLRPTGSAVRRRMARMLKNNVGKGRVKEVSVEDDGDDGSYVAFGPRVEEL
jgi:hypothetical protein